MDHDYGTYESYMRPGSRSLFDICITTGHVSCLWVYPIVTISQLPFNHRDLPGMDIWGLFSKTCRANCPFFSAQNLSHGVVPCHCIFNSNHSILSLSAQYLLGPHFWTDNHRAWNLMCATVFLRRLSNACSEYDGSVVCLLNLSTVMKAARPLTYLGT